MHWYRAASSGSIASVRPDFTIRLGWHLWLVSSIAFSVSRLTRQGGIMLAGCALVGFVGGLSAQSAVNVTQHHNHLNRDGLYIDPAFTYAAASNLTRDLSFNGAVSGNVAAQPLYIEGGPTGRAMVIVATESNNVYALDAANGTVVWQDNVGAPITSAQYPHNPVATSDFFYTNVGITGTPVVDLPSRALLFDAMTTPDNGVTAKHLIFSLNVDTGATNTGWPVDVNATAAYAGKVFTSGTQHQQGALAVLGGIVYVPYGSFLDQGAYYGWLVGVPLNNPSQVTAWATAAQGGGIWAVNGVSSDGTNLFVATGNTSGTSVWGGGEAVIRFQPGPIFSGLTNDYWAPTNWLTLDQQDIDVGSSGALIVDVPGASPSNIVVVLGKGSAYLLDRSNLGGISASLSPPLSLDCVGAPVSYRTSQGTYIVERQDDQRSFNPNDYLVGFRIVVAGPPILSYGAVWLNARGTSVAFGSPFVTSSDGTNNVTVWGIEYALGDQLIGFNGDTGTSVCRGVNAPGVEHMNTAIAARGRIYVAADNQVYAFSVPVPPIDLTNLTVLPSGAVQFAFTNTPGLSFTAFATTDVSQPFTIWTRLGPVTEVSLGQFQFTDALVPGSQQRFYRIRSP
jgi:outer membrane protein assembly factor BamB